MILILYKLWINLLHTGEAISGYTDPDRKQEHAMDGEDRVYAEGRIRAVSQEGVRGLFGFEMVLMSTADVATAKTWIGQAVQVRDHRGQKFFGTFFRISVGEHKPPDLWKVGIELRLVTFTEGV